MSGGYLSDLWIYTKQLDFDTPLGTDYRTSDGTAPHCQSSQFNHPSHILILSSSLVSFNTMQMSSECVQVRLCVILQAFFLAFLNFLFFYDAVIDWFLAVSKLLYVRTYVCASIFSNCSIVTYVRPSTDIALLYVEKDYLVMSSIEC